MSAAGRMSMMSHSLPGERATRRNARRLMGSAGFLKRASDCFLLSVVSAMAVLLSAGVVRAVEVRVISVGSVQVAAKPLAAAFTQQTGHPVNLTIVTPSAIPKNLREADYDMVICSVPAMEVLDKAGALLPDSRRPLSRVGIGVMVREGAPLTDIATPEAFKKTLLEIGRAHV